jgi:hypothetical protein
MNNICILSIKKHNVITIRQVHVPELFWKN